MSEAKPALSENEAKALALKEEGNKALGESHYTQVRTLERVSRNCFYGQGALKGRAGSSPADTCARTQPSRCIVRSLDC